MQGTFNWLASSYPDFIQNYFLLKRMFDFFDTATKGTLLRWWIFRGEESSAFDGWVGLVCLCVHLSREEMLQGCREREKYIWRLFDIFPAENCINRHFSSFRNTFQAHAGHAERNGQIDWINTGSGQNWGMMRKGGISWNRPEKVCVSVIWILKHFVKTWNNMSSVFLLSCTFMRGFLSYSASPLTAET